MNEDLFEQITNAIAVLLENDIDLSTYCVTNLGATLISQDNSIGISNHLPNYPYFVITKGEEEHFFNKGTESGLKNMLPLAIVFFGKFKADQIDDINFTLPTNAKKTVNGIVTYTPTDIMRKIARISGNIINEKINCQIPQLYLEKISIFSEGYYDEPNGVVGSILNLTMYQENRGYNN
jgi:hypothetical protein